MTTPYDDRPLRNRMELRRAGQPRWEVLMVVPGERPWITDVPAESEAQARVSALALYPYRLKGDEMAATVREIAAPVCCDGVRMTPAVTAWGRPFYECRTCGEALWTNNI